MQEKIMIYPAAALFNGRETYFNSQLTEGLENLGYGTNLPQRDGFEFGNLTSALSDQLPDGQIGSAVQNIIYFLDMGVFVAQSDVVLSNLDEPLDEGVVVEASYAKMIGKFTIGFRTDIRSPYGSAEDALRGMHFFPAYQCHRFIPHYMPCKSPAEREEQMADLILKIDRTIKEADIGHKDRLPDYAASNPNLNSIQNGAELLFKEISDIHSKEGLEEIASRYLKHRHELENSGPIII
ncbi:MAG: hypothetical protein U9P44_04360 [archaeon]|nr:hypothetical protein [archaeon]